MNDFHYSGADSCITLANGTRLSLDDPKAFSIISEAWLRCGWDTKYVYGFSWLGRPVIQLPEDMVRIQEVIYDIKPDVIVETGVAHGGSLVFYASLCTAIGKGRVIGVDIEIRPHNRKAIEEHRLSHLISLIEGSSVDSEIIQSVKNQISENDSVLVILDSNHFKNHVLAELEAYSSLVTSGSYIVVCDGIMKDLVGAPRANHDWSWNNPVNAIEEFIAKNPNFECIEHPRPFNEGKINDRVTYWPKCYLKRKAH
jgi:cephalosporin hydroxylase